MICKKTFFILKNFPLTNYTCLVYPNKIRKLVKTAHFYGIIN